MDLIRDTKGTRFSLNWNDINWVLLDMDGTLLDKHFDDYFWEYYLPEQYASKYGFSCNEAREELLRRYRKEEGKLNWTDLDFWSEELGLDIPLLKKEVEYLIKVHPHVISFLKFLNKRDKRTYLVTNAHSKTLELKMKKTGIGDYFEGIISAFDLGLPKERVGFWQKLESAINFNKERTLLVDDSEENLEAAYDYGIKYLLYVAKPSTKSPVKLSPRFPSIISFEDIMP